VKDALNRSGIGPDNRGRQEIQQCGHYIVIGDRDPTMENLPRLFGEV